MKRYIMSINHCSEDLPAYYWLPVENFGEITTRSKPRAEVW